MDQKKIQRINELAKKSKTVGLTVEEKNEQQLLRQEYIQAVKVDLKASLDNIVLVDKDGSRKNLKPN